MEKEIPAPRIRKYMEQQIEVKKELEEQFKLTPDVAEHLSCYYGYRAYQIVEIVEKENNKRLHPKLPFLQAEVLHVIRQEMAIRLSDVLIRRLRIGVMDTALAMECLPTIIKLMKNELSWNDEQCVKVILLIRDDFVGSERYSISIKQVFYSEIQCTSSIRKSFILICLFTTNIKRY